MPLDTPEQFSSAMGSLLLTDDSAKSQSPDPTMPCLIEWGLSSMFEALPVLAISQKHYRSIRSDRQGGSIFVDRAGTYSCLPRSSMP